VARRRRRVRPRESLQVHGFPGEIPILVLAHYSITNVNQIEVSISRDVRVWPLVR
jgi:hypothetical protein